MNHTGFMTREEIKTLIEQLVAREVKKQLAAIKEKPAKQGKLVDIKTLCLELKTSRQTIYNWKKGKYTASLINPYISKIGGKVLYDLAAIRQAVAANENRFGRDRDYQYKYEAGASDEQKNVDRFKSIQAKIMMGKQQELSGEDRIFYEEECKWRGERSRLR